jgi:hypothetical protein
MIEVGTGLVEIDAACSGIRSFQAALMISLFFGALNRLTPSSDLAWCLRASQWLLHSTLFGQRYSQRLQLRRALGYSCLARSSRHRHTSRLFPFDLGTFHIFATWDSPKPSLASTCENRLPAGATVASASAWPRLPHVWVTGLALWLACAEFATFLWFRSIEASGEKVIEWTLNWPEAEPSFRVLPIDETTKRMLRFDHGMQAGWVDPRGKRWQVFHFVWNPGRTAGYLANRHTPEVCLPGMGLELVRADPVATIDIGALCLPYRLFVFRTGSGTMVNVLHSRWEQGMDVRNLSSESPTAYHLLRSIWAGRGRMGQQVLEMAVWGVDDPAKTESAFHEALRNLIAVDAQTAPAHSQLGTAPESYK